MQEILERVGRIDKVCARHGVALPDAALQFALGHPAVSSLVIGEVAPDEVMRNVAALTERCPGFAQGGAASAKACSMREHR